MSVYVQQIIVVVLHSIRSLPARAWMSLSTVVAVAIVVAVLLIFLAMVNGFKSTLQNSGSEDVAVIIAQSAQNELNSALSHEQVHLIENIQGVMSDKDGPIVSPELYVIVNGIKKGNGEKANIPLRGLGPRGMQIRAGTTLKEGRLNESGKNELIVGAAVQRQYEGFDLNNIVRLAGVDWQVVGIFEAGGTVFESEMWTDAKIVQNQFGRGNTYQIVRARLATPGNLLPLKKAIEDDPRLTLDVFSERDYYADQATGGTAYIFYIGWPLSIAMALGALAGALNTMYTSVAQRTREIATLRAIGFSGASAFCGVLVESSILASIGGFIGTLFAYVFFDGLTASTLGNGFTQIVFDFDMTVSVFLEGAKFALLIGFFGGLFPALKASRLPVVKAFSGSH